MKESSYKKFLEEEYLNRKLNLYEKTCRLFDKLPIPIPKFLEEKFKPEIDFCHLRVTPKGAFFTAVFVPFLISILLYSVFFVLGMTSTSIQIILIMLAAIVFYYLFSYTHFLNLFFRSKASSEMTLSIVYMAISLKITQNLETAVGFAASNLSGPLGLDLKKILWDLQVGRIFNVIEGLDDLAEKWKSESSEFVDAITLLQNSINEPPEMSEKSIQEAINLVLSGTKNRMKQYALKMRSPMKIVNTFGILLPLMMMIFLPVMIIFVPEIVKPELIAFGYMVVLPFCLYLFLKQYSYTRPYSYHQIAIKDTESFKKRKMLVTIILGLICSVLIGIFTFNISRSKEIFSDSQFFYSLLINVSIALGVATYAILSSVGFSKRNDAVLKLESELPTVLFELSMTSSIGKPFEKTIEEIQPRIYELEINKFFKKIVNNIRMFGFSLDSAIFDKKIGAILEYPSVILNAVMKLVVDMSKKGMVFLSLSLKAMSNFLKDANEVNEAADEILSEVTSDMQVQAWVFAPVAAGIVVGLLAIVIYIFSFFGESFSQMEKILGSSGVAGFEWIFNIGKQVPFPYFQIIVGVYMIEVVYMLANILGELTYGEDEVNKLMNLGKLMLIAIAIYTVSVCGVYLGITKIIDLSALSGLQ